MRCLQRRTLLRITRRSACPHAPLGPAPSSAAAAALRAALHACLWAGQPATSLVLAAAVDHGAARGAGLEVRRVRLAGAAAIQRAAAQAWRRQTVLHHCMESSPLRRKKPDACLDVARLQHAAALQPLQRVP